MAGKSAPVAQPPARLAPTSTNTLAPAGIALALAADYDRDNTVNPDTKDPKAEYRKRITRPGAILLANLDIDDPSRLPTPAPGTPPPDLSGNLDGGDNVINGAADESDLANLQVESGTPSLSRADTVSIKIHPDDAKRVRMFFKLDPAVKAALAAAFGSSDIIALGKDKGIGDTSDPAETIVTLTFSFFLNQLLIAAGQPPFPAGAFNFDLLVEAITLPGDPAAPAPTAAAPVPPNPYGVVMPAGGAVGKPLHAKRLPGEVWVELNHSNSKGALAAPHETALFTIAPWLLLSNIQPVHEVYVADVPDETFTLSSGVFNSIGNTGLVRELQDIVAGLSGVTLRKVTKAECAAQAIDSSGAPVFDVAGNPVMMSDQWVQDEFEIGYCFAPQGFMHVVLHNRRSRGLKTFVRGGLAGKDVGLFIGVNGPDRDGPDYGGNLEVTPPIHSATGAQPAGDGGPAMPAHPVARHGKILVGDSRGVSLSSGGTHGPLDPPYRAFLQAQKVQPVLPVDTSWLDVGHVDETISFVRAPKVSPDGSGKKGWVMLYASPDRAIQLLRLADKSPSATNLFRSRKPDAGLGATWPRDVGMSSADVLALFAPFSADPARPINRGSGRHKYQKKLDAVLNRLVTGAALSDADFIKIPVLMTPGIPQTHAMTPGMVNLLSLGDDLVIPKPWGPRLSVAEATARLKGFAGITSAMITAADLNTMKGQLYWAMAGEGVAHIASMFDIDEGDLRAANPSLTTGVIGANWTRLQIPEDNVDLFEAFVAVKLKNLGLTVHFVDDWDMYHVQVGEIHCGTNVKREPLEVTDPKLRWWDHYRETAVVPDYTV